MAEARDKDGVLDAREAGKFIRQKMGDLQVKQLAERTSVPDPDYLSNMLNGRINVAKSKHLGSIADALHLTADDIRYLNPNIVVQLGGNAATQGLTPLREFVSLPHLGTVTTGSLDVPSRETRDIPLMFVEGYDLASLFTLDVTPDSMTDPDASFEVPQGSTIVVHRDLKAQAGDVVSVWLPDESIGALRVHNPRSGGTTLQSYNGQSHRLRLNENTPVIVQGVMIGMYKPSRARQPS